MASKSSFFSQSGDQINSKAVSIGVGGTYAANGAGIYTINRSPSSALAFSMPPQAGSVPFTMVVYIIDIKGDAGNYPITITDPNGALISGQSSLIINTNFGAAALIWNGGGWSQFA